MGQYQAPGKTGDGAPKKTQVQPADHPPPRPAPGPYAGKPLDGSQYHDVIDEQQYADQRPTPEEQQPRFSYEHKQKEPDRGKARK